MFPFNPKISQPSYARITQFLNQPKYFYPFPNPTKTIDGHPTSHNKLHERVTQYAACIVKL